MMYCMAIWAVSRPQPTMVVQSASTAVFATQTFCLHDASFLHDSVS